MASNVSNSLRTWNCKIEKDQNNGTNEILKHGSCEYLRGTLPRSHEVIMEAKKMYWITDQTPYESLPLKERKYLQFFKVVTANVPVWFADHSTPNPCGVLPDRNITKNVKGNISETNSLEIIDHDVYSNSLTSKFKAHSQVCGDFWQLKAL